MNAQTGRLVRDMKFYTVVKYIKVKQITTSVSLASSHWLVIGAY